MNWESGADGCVEGMLSLKSRTGNKKQNFKWEKWVPCGVRCS